MSILSRSKASLRGSQPFPDPAFSFQPHGSFPLSSAAASFWCLWVCCLGSPPHPPFLRCFSDQVEHVSLTRVWVGRSRRCAVAEGWRWGTRGRAGKYAAAAIFQTGFSARADVPAATAKPTWLCRVFIRRARQASSWAGAPGAAWGSG